MLVYSRETQNEPVTDLTLMFMVVPVSHGAALLCESVDVHRGGTTILSVSSSDLTRGIHHWRKPL